MRVCRQRRMSPGCESSSVASRGSIFSMKDVAGARPPPQKCKGGVAGCFSLLPAGRRGRQSGGREGGGGRGGDKIITWERKRHALIFRGCVLGQSRSLSSRNVSPERGGTFEQM